MADVPRLLIRARIARGLSQKSLAGRLVLKEQQIQRYEASEYASAKFGSGEECGGGFGGGSLNGDSGDFRRDFWDFGLVVWWCDNEFGVVGDVGYYRGYVNREVPYV